MKITLSVQIKVERHHDDPQPEPQPPAVDTKGSSILERSQQPEPDDMRLGVTEHWYRAGFRPNQENT